METITIEPEAVEVQEARPTSVPALPASATPMELLNQAISGGAEVVVLEKLLALQERWEANQARKSFDAAMSDAKAEIPPIRKNKHVGFKAKNGGASTDYDHEDMGEIARTVDPILSKYGLSYRFRTAQADRITVTCIITHRDGHYEETTLSCSADSSGNKNSIQAIGSAVTYLQRYTIKAALGLATAEDDDGKSSGAPVDGQPSGAITEEQYEQIRTLMETAGVTPQRFCDRFKVDGVAKLPSSDFQRAIDALNAAINTKKERRQ